MPEIADVEIHKPRPGERFGFRREQYSHRRIEAQEDLLKSGLKIETSEFRKARKNVAIKYQEKEDQGETDELTGLLNRRGLKKRLSQEIARARRSGSHLTALNLDLNGLKALNDSRGHKAGDELIKNASMVLKGYARPYDIVARTGGDEIEVVLSTDENGAEIYWNRVNTAFTTGVYIDPITQQEQKFEPISTAAGMCLIDKENLEESFRLADKAMYKSKGITKTIGVNTLQKASDLTTEEIVTSIK